MARSAFVAASLGAALVLVAPQGATAQANPDTPEGTEWHLVSFGSTADGDPILVPWWVDATLSLGSGQADGSTACNYFLSEYRLTRDALTFSTPTSGDVGCGDAAGPIEARFLETLPTVQGWRYDTGPIGDRELLLSDAEGDIVLTFLEASTSLTEADVRAIASTFEAQQAAIEALRARIRDLERAGRDRS